MSFYIIGSKYGNAKHGYTDIYPELIKKGVVAVGFNFNDDLTNYVGASENEISNHLKSKSASSDSISTLKKFLNLKVGDVIAVKRHSSPRGKQARLVIGAFAIVSGINSVDYKHCDTLGHTISVDFIDTDLNIELPLGYGLTVHKLSNQKHIDMIFSPIVVEKQDDGEVTTKIKNTAESLVLRTASYIQRKLHNRIQNNLVKQLELIYEPSSIKVEKNYVDVMVETKDEIILYEVKSSRTPDNCIREALGQILKYGYQLKKNSSKPITYVIVGPSEVNSSADSYFGYIQTILNEKVEYLCVQP
ncbi:hypothetical protein [Thalassotalea euphylliae]|uniref:Uncharacterized protein n=1 Tax=Thalassotalea euphylliae TaxID=1655234 RepID=A0A3E0UCU0_9GAMM|nr:hypothetical protein [Thalassotalea euphylliae]REL34699.1 hypothetical protein DXX92_04630 [Thalassotalea euphylliae]